MHVSYKVYTPVLASKGATEVYILKRLYDEQNFVNKRQRYEHHTLH